MTFFELPISFVYTNWGIFSPLVKCSSICRRLTAQCSSITLIYSSVFLKVDNLFYNSLIIKQKNFIVSVSFFFKI